MIIVDDDDAIVVMSSGDDTVHSDAVMGMTVRWWLSASEGWGSKAFEELRAKSTRSTKIRACRSGFELLYHYTAMRIIPRDR